jgi:DNA-binding MarR family transcriptional regulator
MNKSRINLVKKVDLSNITTYQAGVAQATMHRLLQKHCDDILKPYGITKMQWLIIGTVLDSGAKGVRISDLAKTLGTTISYLTTSINLLESKGFLIRKGNNNDSRSKLVIVNPEHLANCRTIELALREGLRKSIYAEVDPEEFRTYIKVLYELIKVKDTASKN